ncbi:hypothetical protein [Xanthobacter sediminis]
MTPEDEARAAQAILEFPFARALLDKLQQAATNRCVHAPINDDETRRNAAAEARAVIQFRERLEAAARSGEHKPRTVA